MFRIIVGLNQYLNVEQVNSIDDFIESKKERTMIFILLM